MAEPDSGTPGEAIPDSVDPSVAGGESADAPYDEPSDGPDEAGQPAGDYNDGALQEEDAIADGEDAPADAAVEPLAAAAPDAEPLEAYGPMSGEFGECSWSIDDDGLLHVWPTNGESGRLANSRGLDYDRHEMYDYFPWYANRTKITSVVFDPGVQLPSNSSRMFYGCSSLSSLDASGWDTSDRKSVV